MVGHTAARGGSVNGRDHHRGADPPAGRLSLWRDTPQTRPPPLAVPDTLFPMGPLRGWCGRRSGVAKSWEKTEHEQEMPPHRLQSRHPWHCATHRLSPQRSAVSPRGQCPCQRAQTSQRGYTCTVYGYGYTERRVRRAPRLWIDKNLDWQGAEDASPENLPLATSLGTIHSRVCGVQRAAGGAPAAGSGLGHISLAISPGGPPPPASNASGEGEGCDPSSWGGYSSPDSILVIDPRAVAGNDRMMAVGLGRGGQRPQWLARDSRPWALATWLAPGSGPCGHRRPRRGPA